MTRCPGCGFENRDGVHFCEDCGARRTGDEAKAQEHLTTAATMYREMDMGFWLAQAEAALKQPGPRDGR